ncbi:juxtaposed with another zinc finger protein 1 [Rhopalosiphum padi]|uniref:juxtaposed with another zinc finger protein 1 n=1 Tax=Rhopalosiphum padi TaxID=40932 RepID=UPI00298D9162|nr:juxtaposed with another zinc finger protein 1 [Rhopalosiphum padi]
MAVFLLNECKFNNCGLCFKNLYDLIQHIEDKHIDTDPKPIELIDRTEQQCLPLSCVMRFFSENVHKTDIEPAEPVIQPKTSILPPAPNIFHRPLRTGYESDKGETENLDHIGDSSDSWSTTSDAIDDAHKNGPNSQQKVKTEQPIRPFACPIPGCTKRYKNVNGIKYHVKNGHTNGKVHKKYKCHCGKSYVSIQGLKSHANGMHAGTKMTWLTMHNGETIQVPATPLSPDTVPIRAVTLKHVPRTTADANLPPKTLVITKPPPSNIEPPIVES